LNGEDGETHHGLLDISWGRSIPGLVMCAPRDKIDLDFMMSHWLEGESPVMVRYPKDTVTGALAREQEFTPAPWLSSEILRRGSDACVMGIGPTVAPALEAVERCAAVGIASPTVVDLRFASPLDWGTIDPLLSGHSLVIVAEDGYRAGGVGEAIASRAIECGYSCGVRVMGVDALYVPHASRDEQLDDFRLTTSGIFSRIEDFYGVPATRAAG
jgi:1-deoxy-D-xylulose-5-phosphate synthase